MLGPYISIETKKKMKLRTGFSPDLADNAVVMAKLFQKRGLLRLDRVVYPEGVKSGWHEFQKARSLVSDYETVPY